MGKIPFVKKSDWRNDKNAGFTLLKKIKRVIFSVLIFFKMELHF